MGEISKISNHFQILGWKSYIRKPRIVPGTDEWPHMQSYERTHKWEYSAFNFDIEEDTKIQTSTPITGTYGKGGLDA